MNKRIIFQLFGLVLFLAVAVLAVNLAMKNATPAKGFKIKIKEVVYETDSYFMDGEYIVFKDELGREVEVHKNFVNIEEVR